MSFTAAGDALHISKGAVSYQIAKLEGELGFQLFERRHTHIKLTPKGESLLNEAKRHFGQLEAVICQLRDGSDDSLCVGAHSWFISRWLGPRLSDFTHNYPDIAPPRRSWSCFFQTALVNQGVADGKLHDLHNHLGILSRLGLYQNVCIILRESRILHLMEFLHLEMRHNHHRHRAMDSLDLRSRTQ